jgi:hypothetical protein
MILTQLPQNIGIRDLRCTVLTVVSVKNVEGLPGGVPGIIHDAGRVFVETVSRGFTRDLSFTLHLMAVMLALPISKYVSLALQVRDGNPLVFIRRLLINR